VRLRIALDGARLALVAIWSNKLRSFLTLLANVIAVASVIAVVSILAGMDAYVRETVAQEGSGLFEVQRVDQFLALSSFDEYMASRRNPRVTVADAEFLARWIEHADAVSPEVGRSQTVAAGRLSADGVRVRGVGADYAVVRHLELDAGRNLSPSEVQRSAQVTVIGWDVADKLFPGRDPLARIIRFGGRHLRIIGVAERTGSVFGQSRDLFTIVPIGVYQKMFGSRQSVDILVKAASVEQLDIAREEARMAMRIRHRLRPGEREDFALVSSEQLVKLWQGIAQTIGTGLVLVVVVSLIIGGIIIMNIMLVSVTERTREVGVRMALGARRGSILWQFLVEAVTFSASGGVLGILVGFAAAAGVAAATPLPYAIEPVAIVLGLLVTGLVGVVFGLYPANRAARLDPIEALSWE